MRFSVKFGYEGQLREDEMGFHATSHLNAFAHAQSAMEAMRAKGESDWDPEKPGATISVKLLEP